uniref:Uncharacterized protein n=1 Tax=Oryza meridionalis TaxID=40149 RepID=A0A0E0ER61_9ORYZ
MTRCLRTTTSQSRRRACLREKEGKEMDAARPAVVAVCGRNSETAEARDGRIWFDRLVGS